MAYTARTWLPLVALVLVLYAGNAHAFGAGNIGSTSKIEGQNWRHGDIEDTLLTLLTARAMGGKKFSKLDVKRTYFGNWLRDYSQAVDVGTVKNVSAEAIRLILWILGFMTFGYGTGEFEVTRDRLGCYRPEEHIDNPKDYADNQDARRYDRRLRGPVDERRELGIDERTGLKNYIASENLGIATSSAMVRNLLGRCVQLGRQFGQSNDKKDFYEALRLLGTACHCLEDYSAHSNYTELALIEMGERQIFPHVGRRVQIDLQGARGPVYPVITGTFGGTDFLHSVCGEFTDKATQFELDELENTMQQSQNADTSLLKDLLDKLPSGLLGGDKKGKADELQANAQAAQLENMHISPKEPEEFTKQMEQITRQIYPLMEFHDDIVRNISEAIDKLPILPELIEQVQEQVAVFVFSLMAPFVVPIVNQVKSELKTGSTEIIESSKAQQLNVFQDDNCSDPTHSMLSKDHFSNVLNEPAGKVASSVLKWVVPQIVSCWDNDNMDERRTIDRIINGVFHHPAQRQYGEDGAADGRRSMFETVERWWQEKDEREKDELRDQLSRQGVQQGRNHKEGVHDSGHGCGKPLTIPHAKQSQSGGPLGGTLGALSSAAQQGETGFHGKQSNQQANKIGDTVGDAVGGGALGSVVGGLAGAVGAGLLGGVFGSKKDDDDEDEKQQKQYQSSAGSYGQSSGYSGQSSYGQPSRHSQSQSYGQTDSSPGYAQQAGRYERHDATSGGYGSSYEQRTESQPAYGGQYGREQESAFAGGYGDRNESRASRDDGFNRQTQSNYDRGSSGFAEQTQQSYGHTTQGYQTQQTRYGQKKEDSDDSDSNDDDDWEKKQRKQRKKEEKRRRKEQEEGGYGRHKSRSRSGSRERRRSGSRNRSSNDYNRANQSEQYGSSGYGQRSNYEQPSGYARQEAQSEYGRSQEYGRQQPGYDDNDSGRGGYGQQQSGREEYGQSGYGRAQGYGQGEYGRSEEYSGETSYQRRGDDGDNSGGYGRRNDDGDEYGRRNEQSSGYGNESYGGGYGGNSGYGQEDGRGW